MFKVGAGVRVLIVDDEPLLLDVLAEHFRDAGIEVGTTTYSPDAKKQIESEQFKAIVTDLKMPDLDGIQLVKAARCSDLNPQTPVFLISAYLDKTSFGELGNLGVSGVFVKPFDINELIDQVKKYIQPKNRHAQLV